MALQGCNSCIDCALDAAADDHGVCTCGDVLHAFTDECLCEQGSGGGTVAGCIVGLGSNFTNELCAHVFHSVFQFDLLCDGNTVVGDQRSAVLLVENDVAALRTDGDFDGVSELIDTAEQSVSGFDAVYDFLCHD